MAGELDIRWITAFLDRPPAAFDSTVAFWTAATGSTLSARRGLHDEFATLLPADGDAYLRVQRTSDGSAGTHIDLHVIDVSAAADAAVSMGARRDDTPSSVPVLRSPGGLAFCLVEHRGETTRPAPRPVGDTGALLVDQVCVDVASARWEEETAFWETLTGWSRLGPGRPEFRRLQVPDPMPLRLLVQRRDDDVGPTRAHLDLASDDRAGHAAVLEGLGAVTVGEGAVWTVMRDPSGVEFCVTWRDPRTGGPPDAQ